MNKKGTIAIEKTIFYGFVISVLLAVLYLILAVILGIDIMGYAKISPGLEEFIYTQRFLNSPECFVYQDNEIIKPRVIDWNKFNTYSPSKCYLTTDENNPAFRFSLYNLDDTDKTKTPPQFETKNWHGDPNKIKEFDVKIIEDGELYNGELVVEMKNVE